ncbi:hypothetical protein AAFP30_22320 [Gordonia sp. CPCC 205515]|uniref:hypothetical protein n=1 Tax=Gordonia sp. CPCC 205515 TaxID=3140791 RepID=UPI003AF396A2
MSNLTTIWDRPLRRRQHAEDHLAGDWIDGRPHVDGRIASLDRLGWWIAVYESHGHPPTIGRDAYDRMTAAGGGFARLAARLDLKEEPRR